MEIRSTTTEDLGFLEAILFEAFFWDVTAERPALSTFGRHPEFTKLLSGWGRHGDLGLIAEEGGKQLGAAWFRLWTTELHSYGFVDATTPELGIAVLPIYRRQGVGLALLRELITRACAEGFAAVSLSVDPCNPARGLYESLGFQKVGESGTSWTFRLPLK